MPTMRPDCFVCSYLAVVSLSFSCLPLSDDAALLGQRLLDRETVLVGLAETHDHLLPFVTTFRVSVDGVEGGSGGGEGRGKGAVLVIALGCPLFPSLPLLWCPSWDSVRGAVGCLGFCW
ncbi:MAG: hypothetical protein EXX96DRAFT_582431 [Benjaminiella poitrasii]|nr:MAG: hypothetical protein EXX96DRAFT_582431 [Benjaminiella poitrasii]